jgi:hypothetical protein
MTAPDPEPASAAFRARLADILREAVNRLQELADELGIRPDGRAPRGEP